MQSLATVALAALVSLACARTQTVGPSQANDGRGQARPARKIAFAGAAVPTAGAVRFVNSYEHMYTTNPTEMDALRGQSGYGTEGRAFEVRTTSAPDTVAVRRVRLGQYHVFTVNLGLVSQMESWGGIDEGLLGYVNSAYAAGLVPLYSYVDGKTQSRFLTVDTAEAPPAGTSVDWACLSADSHGCIIGYVKPSPKYKVGAYYFGMFSANFAPTFADRSFYTNGVATDPWQGLRQIHDKQTFAINWADEAWAHFGIPAGGCAVTNTGAGTTGCYWQWLNDRRGAGVSSISRQPAIGFYDVSRPATLQQQIDQAASAGLSFFNFYYYVGPNNYPNGMELNADGLHSFLSAPNSAKMQFMLSFCQHGGGWFGIGRSELANVANNIATSYFSRSNYLRVPSTGQPIFELCDAMGFGEDTQIVNGSYQNPSSIDWTSTGPLNAFLNDLRAASMRTIGQYPVILGMFDNRPADYVQGLNNLVEGGTCLLSWHPNDGDHNHQDASTKGNLETIRTWKPFMPCVAVDMDERPRMGAMKAWPHGPNEFAIMYNYSLDGWQTALTQAKYWMDTQSDEISQFLSVYAWNEWHEGGIIEPSEADGRARSQSIQSVFNLVGR